MDRGFRHGTDGTVPMKRPLISCDYSRLPGALFPTLTFMAAAALLHAAAYAVSAEEVRTLLSMLAAVPALILFRILYGPVFLLRALPEYGSGSGPFKEAGANRSLLRVSAVLSAVTAAPALNILLAMLAPSAFMSSTAGSRLSHAAVFAASCFFAPLCEELVFRCHLYPVLKRILGGNAAVVLSSLLFGLYHEDLIQGIYAACMGMILCLCYRSLGGFRGAFAVHAGVNLIMLIFSWSGAFAHMVRPAYLASFAGCAAVSLSMHFYLQRVLHL